MTGYLHIPESAAVEAICAWRYNAEYAPFKWPGDASERLQAVFRSEALAVLRGLSVEPTEEANIRADERQRLADQLDRVLDAIEGSPTHRLRMEPGTALAGLHRAATWLRNCGPRPRRDEGALILSLAAPVPVQEDGGTTNICSPEVPQDGPPAPLCEHGRAKAHWFPEPTCVEQWPECVSFGYDPRCCRFPKSCSADEWCEGPAAVAETAAPSVQEDRP